MTADEKKGKSAATKRVARKPGAGKSGTAKSGTAKSGTAKSGTAKSGAAKQTRRSRKADEERRSLGRLERILLLVPFVVSNQGVTVAELTQRFGATREEILEDLDLVFMCGLPDYTPADLIDVVVEGETVSIRMADYFSRPLRLTRSEAIPLYVKAQAMLDLLREGKVGGAGFDELGPLRSALAKLRAALLPQDGGVAELTERIKVHLEAGEAKWLPVLREAVTARRRVRLEYYTYGRDTLTQREVDPFLVFASLGHWYMSGYCHMVEDRRIFRLDRIKDLELLTETFEPPHDAADDLPPPALYEPGRDDPHVTIRVASRVATWLEEYIPVESARTIKGGRRELKFRTSQFPWLEKLFVRYGPDVEVVEPKELAERVRTRAARILEQYEPKR